MKTGVKFRHPEITDEDKRNNQVALELAKDIKILAKQQGRSESDVAQEFFDEGDVFDMIVAGVFRNESK